MAVLVNLASANTNYNLLALVNAILATTAECPGMAREVNIQANPGIDGAAGNTKSVLIGDAELSATRFGYLLNAGDARLYRGTLNNVDVGSIYVRSSGTNQKLAVEIVTG